jgi:capsular exopolysaccharide synthesis family protein
LVAPHALLILSIALACGIVVGAGAVFLAEIIDQSFRSTDEIHRRLQLPVLGSTPRLRRARRRRGLSKRIHRRIHAYYRPESRQADAFRAMRIAIQARMKRDGCKLLQVTGARERDGASTLVANLAVSLANSGKNVLIVDADLRQPRQHQYFGIPNDVGLTDVLSEDAAVEQTFRRTEVPSLWILPAGTRSPDAAELLSSARFEQFLEVVRDQFDIVLIDTPGVLAASDSCVVAQFADKVILVVKNSRRSRREVDQAIGMLRIVNAPILGIVMNACGKRGTYTPSPIATEPSGNGAEPHRNGDRYGIRRIVANPADRVDDGLAVAANR